MKPDAQTANRWTALALAGLLVAGCTGTPAGAEGDSSEQLADLDRDITALIGEAACESDDQCKITAFGSKPCGGPAGYRVYSSLDTDTALLETRVNEYNRLAVQYNRETNALSDCSMVVAPMAFCATGQCKTGTNRPAPAPP